jgi:hypothetical protein
VTGISFDRAESFFRLGTEKPADKDMRVSRSAEPREEARKRGVTVETLVANRRLFRMTPDRQFAMKTLAVATFALLCAGCTTASADCGDEVAAAFERLTTSGRPYRMETTSVITDRQTSRQTSEFVPPDRMRTATNNGVSDSTETIRIRVGQRAWSNEGGGWPWGWREWDTRPDDALLRARIEKIPADDVGARPRIFRGGKDFAVVHFLLLQNYSIPADAMFECLGRVELEGTTYIGYRTRFVRTRIEAVAPGASSETRQQEFSRKPQEWRTVLVDRESMLPAYDLVSQAHQLDNPSHKVQCTYPIDIKIEPPFWCRLGLCPVHR